MPKSVQRIKHEDHGMLLVTILQLQQKIGGVGDHCCVFMHSEVWE
jgi:hypothetical protein